MSITYDQKNINILNRFESKEGSSRCKAYKLNLNDGISMTIISMNGELLDDLINAQKAKWGKRFKSLIRV